jgi:hypothetical protein
VRERNPTAEEEVSNFSKSTITGRMDSGRLEKSINFIEFRNEVKTKGNKENNEKVSFQSDFSSSFFSFSRLRLLLKDFLLSGDGCKDSHRSSARDFLSSRHLA